jgi:hypothetical protein
LLKDIRKKQNEVKKRKVVPAAGAKEEVKEGEEEGGSSEEKKESTEGTATGGPTEEEEEKFMDEDTGSVASSTKSLMKHLRMLRSALYENYSPSSIRNLKVYSKVVFFMLLLLTIAWFVYAQGIYLLLRENVQNIHSSKNRLISLTEVGADVRILSYMKTGNIDAQRGGKDYIAFKREQLLTSATTLQQA